MKLLDMKRHGRQAGRVAGAVALALTSATALAAANIGVGDVAGDTNALLDSDAFNLLSTGAGLDHGGGVGHGLGVEEDVAKGSATHSHELIGKENCRRREMLLQPVFHNIAQLSNRCVQIVMTSCH